MGLVGVEVVRLEFLDLGFQLVVGTLDVGERMVLFGGSLQFLQFSLQSGGAGVFFRLEEFQKFVCENLSAGVPIMVENVEWGGQWRVIIGYDTMGTKNSLDDVLILVDPYDTCDHKQDGYVVNNGEKFFSMWFDHSMLPEEQKEQPFIIARP